MSNELTHINSEGDLEMVDVSSKEIQHRVATASATFSASESTITRILSDDLPKGAAFSVARIAGIMAAKNTDQSIPLCHTLPIEHVDIDFHQSSPTSIEITASVTVQAKTGVEMEALSAVSTAALTLWDMTKAIDTNLSISDVTLKSKTKTPLTSI